MSVNAETQQKPANIAINGSGTIGRAAIIEILKSPTCQFNLVAVNDKMPIDGAAQLLDQLFHERYGERWRVHPSQDKAALSIITPEKKEFSIPYFQSDGTLPWNKIDTDIDIVMECSGAYKIRELLQKHLDKGVKKVLLSARSKEVDDVDRTVVFGVNHDEITAQDTLISNASCTTNAAAHILKMMEDRFGFEHCVASSTHTPLNRHLAYDHGANTEEGFDTVFGIANNVITRNGSLGSLAPRVLGEKFNGRIISKTVFAPFKGGSLMSMVFTLRTTPEIAKLTPDDINTLFKDYMATMPHENVLESFEREVSAARVKRTPYSAALDTNRTNINHGPNSTMIEINVWHDTAWGFAPRMLDVAQKMHEVGYEEPIAA